MTLFFFQVPFRSFCVAGKFLKVMFTRQILFISRCREVVFGIPFCYSTASTDNAGDSNHNIGLLTAGATDGVLGSFVIFSFQVNQSGNGYFVINCLGCDILKTAVTVVVDSGTVQVGAAEVPSSEYNPGGKSDI